MERTRLLGGQEAAAGGATWGSCKEGSLHITAGLQPRNPSVVEVALRRSSVGADPVDCEVRPTPFGKKRAHAPKGHCGVRGQAPRQGRRRSRRDGPSASRDGRQPAQTRGQRDNPRQREAYGLTHEPVGARQEGAGLPTGSPRARHPRAHLGMGTGALGLVTGTNAAQPRPLSLTSWSPP
jgi:hypothetical protein